MAAKKYSFVFVLIRLTSHVSMDKIQKKCSFRMRLVGLISTKTREYFVGHHLCIRAIKPQWLHEYERMIDWHWRHTSEMVQYKDKCLATGKGTTYWKDFRVLHSHLELNNTFSCFFTLCRPTIMTWLKDFHHVLSSSHIQYPFMFRVLHKILILVPTSQKIVFEHKSSNP